MNASEIRPVKPVSAASLSQRSERIVATLTRHSVAATVVDVVDHVRRLRAGRNVNEQAAPAWPAGVGDLVAAMFGCQSMVDPPGESPCVAPAGKAAGAPRFIVPFRNKIGVEAFQERVSTRRQFKISGLVPCLPARFFSVRPSDRAGCAARSQETGFS